MATKKSADLWCYKRDFYSQQAKSYKRKADMRKDKTLESCMDYTQAVIYYLQYAAVSLSYKEASNALSIFNSKEVKKILRTAKILNAKCVNKAQSGVVTHQRSIADGSTTPVSDSSIDKATRERIDIMDVLMLKLEAHMEIQTYKICISREYIRKQARRMQTGIDNQTKPVTQNDSTVSAKRLLENESAFGNDQQAKKTKILPSNELSEYALSKERAPVNDQPKDTSVTAAVPKNVDNTIAPQVPPQNALNMPPKVAVSIISENNEPKNGPPQKTKENVAQGTAKTASVPKNLNQDKTVLKSKPKAAAKDEKLTKPPPKAAVASKELKKVNASSEPSQKPSVKSSKAALTVKNETKTFVDVDLFGFGKSEILAEGSVSKIKPKSEVKEKLVIDCFGENARVATKVEIKPKKISRPMPTKQELATIPKPAKIEYNPHEVMPVYTFLEPPSEPKKEHKERAPIERQSGQESFDRKMKKEVKTTPDSFSAQNMSSSNTMQVASSYTVNVTSSNTIKITSSNSSKMTSSDAQNKLTSPDAKSPDAPMEVDCDQNQGEVALQVTCQQTAQHSAVKPQEKVSTHNNQITDPSEHMATARKVWTEIDKMLQNHEIKCFFQTVDKAVSYGVSLDSDPEPFLYYCTSVVNLVRPRIAVDSSINIRNGLRQTDSTTNRANFTPSDLIGAAWAPPS